MESVSTISKLEIPINKVFYSKKSKILSVDLFGFVFVGHYKNSVKVSEILDDIFASLKEIKFDRSSICFLDYNNLPISEKKKLKNLRLKEKIEKEKKKPKKGKIEKEVGKKADKIEEKKVSEKTRKDKRKRASKTAPSKKQVEYSYTRDSKEEARFKREIDVSTDDEILMKDTAEDLDELSYSTKAPTTASVPPPPPAPSPEPSPPGGAAAGAPATSARAEPEEYEEEGELTEEELPKPTTYNINMGFQYYSVMMEQKSYLFYVYFSHEELKIMDEEGKTIYKTTFTVTTFKKEPPILDLRIEGEGFEVHPLAGKVEVKKDAVNPPVMIFSVLPIKLPKSEKKKRKKKSERRYLNVYIDFENKTISHSVLSIIVQPKHYHLDLGPIHLDISKRTAMTISFISVLVATISTIYSFLNFEVTSLTDIVSGFAPGLASFIFFAVFIITLFKNGIYPLKQKWAALLNFDKGPTMIK